jgi:molybdopterin synthase catalytic subunit
MMRTMIDEWMEILDQEIDAAGVVGFVTDARAGGIAMFLGTTRAERNDRGRVLVALDYDAYREMAQKQLRELADQARKRWPVVKLALVHRTGRVKLGEASVAIAVSSPHRGDAFEACRWLIDSLKSTAVIWKKEIWDDGSGTWVHPTR